MSSSTIIPDGIRICVGDCFEVTDELQPFSAGDEFTVDSARGSGSSAMVVVVNNREEERFTGKRFSELLNEGRLRQKD